MSGGIWNRLVDVFGSGYEARTMNKMISEVWENNNRYKTEPSGRPLADLDIDDLDRDGDRSERLTYSETVGYKLFMEVLMAAKARKNGDKSMEDMAKANFSKVWDWAQKNLRRDSIARTYDPILDTYKEVPERKKDSLLAWRYIPGAGVMSHPGLSPDGIHVDGLDAATDGDLFTVAALRLAAVMWPEDSGYLESAKEMAADIHAKYVVNIEGEPYLLAGDEFSQISGINPSYSFEAIYDMLAELDPKNAEDWVRIKGTSMKAAIVGADSDLMAGGAARFGGSKYDFEMRPVRGTSNMPPNWLSYDGDKFRNNAWFDANDWICGWDGLRTLWMKASYFLYDGNEAARRYLTDSTGGKSDFGPYGFLKSHFDRNGKLPSGFGIDGSHVGKELSAQNLTEPTAFSLGIYLGYFYAAGDKRIARHMLDSLASIYNPKSSGGEIKIGEGTFSKVDSKESMDYFGDYWAWFGLAMASGVLETAFDMYKEWRVQNGLQRVVPAVFNADYFKSKTEPRVFKFSKSLASNNEWLSPFDGCSNRLLGGYSCRGRAKNWYVGGIGIGILSEDRYALSKKYDGIFIDAEGKSGIIKIEIFSLQGKYTYEVPASNASKLYVPFGSFREEVNHTPSGEHFLKRERYIKKIQVIGIGDRSDGPVDFVLKDISVVKNR